MAHIITIVKMDNEENTEKARYATNDDTSKTL
jgi:hypothetical protein